jgi:hypothetical protein
VGPDDLANPTDSPDPEPPGGGDGSIPTPERVDTGLGGAAGRLPGLGAAPVAALLALALLLLFAAGRRRRSASRSAR